MLRVPVTLSSPSHGIIEVTVDRCLELKIHEPIVPIDRNDLSQVTLQNLPLGIFTREFAHRLVSFPGVLLAECHKSTNSVRLHIHDLPSIEKMQERQNLFSQLSRHVQIAFGIFSIGAREVQPVITIEGESVIRAPILLKAVSHTVLELSLDHNLSLNVLSPIVIVMAVTEAHERTDADLYLLGDLTAQFVQNLTTNLDILAVVLQHNSNTVYLRVSPLPGPEHKEERMIIFDSIADTVKHAVKAFEMGHYQVIAEITVACD